MEKTVKEILNKVSMSAFMILVLSCGVLHLTNGLGGLIAERSLNNITAFTICMTIVILFVNILFYAERLEVVSGWKR